MISALVILLALFQAVVLRGEELQATSPRYVISHRILDLGGGRSGAGNIGFETSLGGLGGTFRTADARITFELGRPGFLTADDPLNYAPMANPNTVTRQAGLTAKVKASTLLANDTDPEGRPLTLQTVSSSSLQGATITRDGDWILYAPPAALQSTDSFTYTLRDDQGALATGTVTVNVVTPAVAPTLNVVAVESISNSTQKRIRLAGIPGRIYVIQVTPTLTNPVWTTLGQATAGANGAYEIVDAEAGSSPSRFYRAIWP